MLELVLAAVALSAPNACGANPVPGGPPVCGIPGPRAPTGPQPPVIQTSTPELPSYQPVLILPSRIRVGETVQIWARDQVPGTLCYSDGSSKIGCASTGLGVWHLVVRPGVTQYLTFVSNGVVSDRREYRNGRLITRR